jgi:hypothetical protein
LLHDDGEFREVDLEVVPQEDPLFFCAEPMPVAAAAAAAHQPSDENSKKKTKNKPALSLSVPDSNYETVPSPKGRDPVADSFLGDAEGGSSKGYKVLGERFTWAE